MGMLTITSHGKFFSISQEENCNFQTWKFHLDGLEISLYSFHERERKSSRHTTWVCTRYWYSGGQDVKEPSATQLQIAEVSVPWSIQTKALEFVQAKIRLNLFG
jgi:hypothetical protein